MFVPRAQVLCLVCHCSVLRSRRYTLTEELYNRHSRIIENIQSAVSTVITYNNQEHVCNRCWVRAGRGRLEPITAESVQESAQGAQEQHNPDNISADEQEQHSPSILVQPDHSQEEPENVVVQPQHNPDNISADEQEQHSPSIFVQPDHSHEEPENVVVQPQHNPDNMSADEDEENQNPPPLNPNVYFSLPGYSRAPNTGRTCIFYGCENTTRRRIPESIKMKMAVDHDFYIPPEARVCHIHASTGSWQILLSSPNRRFNFKPQYTVDMLQLLKKAVNHHLDFERIEDFDPQELYYWTGRTMEQFLQVLHETPSLAQRSRKPKTVLGVYLAKLRTGEADDRLATLFGMTRQNLEHKFNVARECLTDAFVHLHLGFDHISREELSNRNLLIPRSLFCDAHNEKVAVICDATYIYIQKSANFAFQKDTYSLHKYRNLLKPFVIVSTDGYILDVLGPYAATKNDASILRELLEDENSVLPWYFNHGDVFILDRGFRDVVRTLEDLGYRAVIPVGSVRSSQQLSTDQANKSRLCTICRWPVEVVNGRFKRDFRLFRQNYFNKSMMHMFQDFRIAAALTNAFHIPLEDNRHASQFLNIIQNKLNHPNRLADYVDANHLNRQRVAFNNILGDVPNLPQFPQLTHDELILFSVGTYQLKLAASYYSEHVRGGDYSIEICAQHQVAHLGNFDLPHGDVCLIRARIKSRHSGSKTYFCYILIDSNLEGRASIDNYCCNCFTGRRTIGACAHVMSVVWYLAWARHQGEIHRPALYLDEVIYNNDE